MGIGPIGPVGEAPASASGAAAPLVIAPGAEDSLRTEARSVFVVDPAAAAIHVSVDLTLTNEAGPGWFYYGFSAPVLKAATNVVATRDDGTALSVSIKDAENPWTNWADISLRPNLTSGQTVTIRLTYDLPNQAPRSNGVRVTDAFVGFQAFSPGWPGLASIEVRIPDRYAVEVGGDELDREDEAGEIVLTTSEIADPTRFTSVIIGSDEDHLLTRSVDVDGTPVEIRAWPDDPEWVEFAAQHVGGTAPILVELTGLPWPDRSLDIVETQAPYAHGYAGWYDEREHAISIGDELDALVMAHEMAHIWFNGDLFAERWINEGLAEEYATRALEAQGQNQASPVAPDRAGEGAVSLNEWSEPSIRDNEPEATMSYGYAASWYVMSALADEVGVEKLREVFAAVDEGDISYVGDPDPEQQSGTSNWQRLLDLLEERAGSLQATQLFDSYVVSDSERPLLAERTTARTAYAELETRGGEWTPPSEVRKVLSEWSFAELTALLEDANAVLDLRDEALDALEGTDVQQLGLEDRYESASDIGGVVPEARETVEAAEAYRDASERYDSGPGNPLGALGLMGADTGDRIDDARDELEGGDAAASIEASEAVEDRMDQATRDGALRAGGTVVVLGGAGFGFVQWRRYRRRRAERPPTPPMPPRAPILMPPLPLPPRQQTPWPPPAPPPPPVRTPTPGSRPPTSPPMSPPTSPPLPRVPTPPSSWDRPGP